MAKPPAPPQLTELQPRNAVNIVIQLIFAATGVPMKFPAVAVPPGLTVGLTGTNGTVANTANAYAASYPENLTQAGRVVIPPTLSPQSEVQFPADNLGQIWVMGTAGDGVVATIRGAAIG
jgi:hypothetical protein